MPDSLLTTKRKFYKFLDQLSRPPPSPSSATTPISTTTPSRKRPLSTSSATTTNAANRPPIDLEALLAARAAKRLRPSPSSASLASFRARLDYPPPPPPKSAAAPLTSHPRGPGPGPDPRASVAVPAFSPWSHEAFLARLRTFAPVTEWLPKPDERVGEVAWASRGWGCVGVETVGCGACGARVGVDFRGPRYDVRGRARDDGEGDADGGFGSARVEVLAGDGGGEMEDREEGGEGEEDELEHEAAFEQAIVARYAALIIEGHAENCLWRRTGCKDDIYRLPVVRSAWWQSHVREAYASAASIAGEVGKVRFAAVEGAQPGIETILRDLPESFLGGGAASSTIPGVETSTADAEAEAQDRQAESNKSTLQQKLLTIALTGWTASTESSTQLLTCSACFQRIGLWLYQGTASTASSALHDKESAGRDEDNDDEDDTLSALDLVAQHREHCPWRNATSQAATGTYKDWPAYRILWDVVGRYAAEQRRRSRDRYGSVAAVDDGGEAGDGEGVVAVDASVAEDGVAEEAAEQTGVVSVEVGQGAGKKDWERREETARLDRERTHKLRRLRRVLGFKFRMPAAS